MMDKTMIDTQNALRENVLLPVETAVNAGMALLKEKKVVLLEYSEQDKELGAKLENSRDECMAIYDSVDLLQFWEF